MILEPNQIQSLTNNFSYVILDDSAQSIAETRAVLSHFNVLNFAGQAQSYEAGLDLILEVTPAFVFIEIDPSSPESNLSLNIINELHRYLDCLPKFIVTTKTLDFSHLAIKFEVFDYHLKPLKISEMRKTILRCKDLRVANGTGGKTPPHVDDLATETITTAIFDVPAEIFEQPVEVFDQPVDDKSELQPNIKPLTICVKSYGDYRFISADDICYLQADNNSTDIHLNNGEMITAFKTLKHFENVLQSPFVRIHNSYIVNIDYVSRIHTGNSVCYIKNTTTKLPFSKSYKENIDSILNSITKGNYLEI